ncbi:MAG TPA: glutamate formimidoyltransferase [Candidatus Mcinerneyibacteriales bacterium]|nr:glutamate formimidoyltransferase [Candidatus Mcinerneyibacteriales bacterium]
MQKIIECVPNFSEGRNMGLIDKITAEISQTEGVVLLDVDPGKDTNRTVVTFVGSPEGVKEAAYKAIKKASELIDMRQHSGAHPRMGATDVCPLIPVSGVSVEECVSLAREIGRRVGEELNIPVYLYEEAATRPERKNLAAIRKGEYEALPEKMKDPDFAPDFGPAEFNARAGATVIGVREFLLAYNINLNTRDQKAAHDIALTIRESGRSKRDRQGKIVRDAQGKAVKVPGLLQNCKAVGWYIDEYGYAQISMNLTNYKVTNLHQAFETVSREAAKRGLRVTGSEVVGLLPKEALLEAGRYFLKKQKKNTGIPEKEIIHTAVLSLGLNDTTPFIPSEKIIEYRIHPEQRGLGALSVKDFVDELSSDSPAPGGGSVAALAGALSAALSSMVANLTFGKKGYERRNPLMEEVSQRAQRAKRDYLALIDRDTEAFNIYMDAMKMPKKSDEEIKRRAEAMEAAAIRATEIPLETLKEAENLCSLAEIVGKKGNPNAASDAAVAALMAEAAAEGAYLNVLINLPGINDKSFKERAAREADEALSRVKKKRRAIVSAVKRKISADQ